MSTTEQRPQPQDGTAQVGAARASTAPVGAARAGTAQVGTKQVGTTEARTAEDGGAPRPAVRSGAGGAGAGRLAASAAGAFAVLMAAFWVSWPLGVALGLVAGVLVTWRIGQRMHASAQAVPVASGLTPADDELWQEFRRLRVRLGDDWAGFSAAAMVVTREQTASAALLRRELGTTTGQAQHLIALLEREGFVGPPRGTQPRLVRVGREQGESLQELLHA